MMAIPAYQQRVIEELAQLEDRLNKLNAFLVSTAIGKVDDEDILLLMKQSVAMSALRDILSERISRFPRTEQETIDEAQARR